MKRKRRRVIRVAALFYLKPYIVVCLRQAFINEAEDMLNSATLGLGRMDFSNTPSGHTPSVIGTQEVYRYGTAPVPTYRECFGSGPGSAFTSPPRSGTLPVPKSFQFLSFIFGANQN